MTEREPERLLTATGLVAGYEGKQVLAGVDLHVTRGELVAIIGHNGAGKTTLLKTLFGLVPMSAGTVSLSGGRWEPNPAALLQAGMAFVPPGGRVFPALTVRENLRAAVISAGARATFDDGLERILTIFPTLRSRLHRVAGTLSGGERQVLAMGRALILDPRLLLFDEPSLGLSPPMITTALELIRSLATDQSMGIVVVEQKVRDVLRVASRVCVLRQGTVAFEGAAVDLLENEERLRETYL